MKVKALWIPFLIFLFAAVPFRAYQSRYWIEPVTGFFTGGENLYPIFLGVLAVFVLVIMLMTGNCKNAPEFEFRRNIFSGVFALLAGLLMLVDSGSMLMNYVLRYAAVNQLVLSISGVLSAVAFILAAVSHFTGRNLFYKAPVLALLLPLWVCVRAVVLTFIEYTNVTTVSGNMLNILAVLGLLMFLFTLAKLLTGLTTPNTGKRAVMLGMIAVLFVLVSGVSILGMKWLSGSLSVVPTEAQYAADFTSTLTLGADLAVVLYTVGLLVQLTAQLSRPRSFLPADEGEEAGPEVGSQGIAPTAESTYFNSLVSERNSGRYRPQPQEVTSAEHTAEYPIAHLREAVKPRRDLQDTKEATPAAAQTPAAVIPQTADPIVMEKPVQEAAALAEEKKDAPVSKNPEDIDMSYIDNLIKEISDHKE